MSKFGYAFVGDDIEPSDEMLVGMKEVPATANIVDIDEFFMGSPELPAVIQDAFREQGTSHIPSAAEPSRVPSVLSEGGFQAREPRIQNLLASAEPQNNSSIPHRISTNHSFPDPPALTEVGRTMPLPSWPPFSGPSPSVRPNYGYNMLPLPSLPRSVNRPPPVPPKDKPTRAAFSSHYATNSPHHYPVGSRPQQHAVRYPHQPLLSIPAYADVEELALDPEERPGGAPTSRDAEAMNYGSVFAENPLRPPTPLETGMEDLDMDSSPRCSPERPRYLSDRHQHDGYESESSSSDDADCSERRRQLAALKSEDKARRQRREPLKGPITVQLVDPHRPRKLAAAIGTALANAGKSGYVPRGQRLRKRGHKKSNTDAEVEERKRHLARLRYTKRQQLNKALGRSNIFDLMDSQAQDATAENTTANASAAFKG